MKIIKKYASYGRNLLKEKEEIKISSYQCFDIQCEGSGTDPVRLDGVRFLSTMPKLYLIISRFSSFEIIQNTRFQMLV